MAYVTQNNTDEPEDQLYLLEVIVDRVAVLQEGILETFQDGAEESKETTEEASKSPPGAIRVLVKFFDFPTIEIQEKEFKKEEVGDEEDNQETLETERFEQEEDITATATKEPSKVSTEKPPPTPTASQIKEDMLFKRKMSEENRWKAEGRNVNAQLATFEDSGVPPNKFSGGKSCLFPMAPQEMIDVVKKYFVEVQVHRDATESEPAHLIGAARLLLGEEFVDAINLANSPSSALPITAFTENVYDLNNVFGDLTGHVNLMMRLSCFGSTIFTQFKYIQGERGFKFSTSEGVMMPKPDIRQQAIRKELKPEVEQIDERKPFFTREDDVGLFVGPSLPDDFKVPVPWRKLCDDPIEPISCGPKRLFKERKPQTETNVEEDIDLAQMFPSMNTSGAMMKSYPAGQPPSSGTVFEGATCRGQRLTATALGLGGCYSTYEDTSLLPGQRGTGRGVLDIPPGIKFPCQFGADWIIEAGPCECANKPRNKRQGRFPSKSDLKHCMSYCGNQWCEQGRVPYKTDSSTLLDMLPSPPKYVCSSASSQRSKTGDYPSIEQAPPYLRSAAPGMFDTTQANVQQSATSCIPSSNKVDGKLPIRPVVCGLERLLDPNQQNLNHLLQQPLLSPQCPPDTMNKTRPALCSCPKVPKLTPQPLPGGILKCECNSIMTAMKPIDLPYTCQPPQSGLSQPVPTSPCPPLPTKQQPPVPDCPLAKILKEAASQETTCQTKGTASSEKNETSQAILSSAKGKTDKELTDKDLTSEGQKNTGPPSTTEQTPKMSEEPKSHKRSQQEKAKKILQEETAQHTTMPSYTTEISPNDGDDKTSKASMASSVTDSRSQQARRSPKKKQKKGISRESLNRPPPPASIYPGCVIGHKDCIPTIRWVPKRMGWLWNIKDADGYMKPGRGWRPGSIPTNVIKIMDNVKTSEQSKAKTRARMTRKVENTRHMAAGGGDTAMYYPVDDTPTVHIHKKHGKLYLSLCPRKRDNRQNPDSKGAGSLEGEGDEDSDRPAQFRIDLKNPDGLKLDPDLYEPDSTSSNSEDSYEMEIVSPSTLRNRQPQAIMHHIEIQVTEENFMHLSPEVKHSDVKPTKVKSGTHKGGRKRSTKDSEAKRKSGAGKSKTTKAK